MWYAQYFQNTVIYDRKLLMHATACTGYVGFCSFLAEITVFWRYCDTIKKTWVTLNEAFHIFGWMFLEGFDVLKLCLHRLQAKAAKMSDSHFWRKKNLFTVE